MQQQPAALQGRWVSLRPIMDADLPTLWRWRIDTADLMLWAGDWLLPTQFAYTAVIRDAERQGELRFGIVQNSTGLLIGQIFTFALDLRNGHTSFGQYLAPQHRYTRHGPEATALFFRYLFTHFNLVKIYLDAYEYNTHIVRIAPRMGFVEEAYRRDHIRYQGKRWGVFTFAMYRDGLTRAERLLQRIADSRGSVAPSVPSDTS